ncbi:ArsR family transcriptional regulator [Arthrobacter sp. MYb211]|uniref:IclR family transcriptional regulator n=1 Tax=unclassified Arthrobacter TaxID=235627 RepID=UPI000CFC2093|nr:MULTISPECIES: helix-turn-helix domain-containing protein [unclassified Arthrobacter]PRA08267.1 ArsR family transcriptional regulator [Arthrobacter sp. MYb221]PRC02881.1 ArsR family transcriptional regulator [Arthrobacter sp. MYb211]
MSETTANRQLDRICLILDALEFGDATASELARRTGLSTSTAHRLALNLAEYDFLRREPSGSFSLGRRFVRSRLEIVGLSYLTELRDTTGETAQLWIRRGDARVCVASVDSRHELKATLPVGASLALPHGSSGRLLAFDAAAISAVEANGWVESVGLRTPGLGSVSAPITQKDHVVASICLAMPLSRCAVSPGADHGALVAHTAAQISQAFANQR